MRKNPFHERGPKPTPVGEEACCPQPEFQNANISISSDVDRVPSDPSGNFEGRSDDVRFEPHFTPREHWDGEGLLG